MAIERYNNNGRTTVAAPGYVAGSTTLVVDDGAKLPTLTGGDQFHITIFTPSAPTNAEIMKVTARVGNTLTVEPAAEVIGGVQVEFDHPVGDTVATSLTKDALDQITQQIAGALVLAAIINHEGADDPHPQYLSDDEAEATYSHLGHTHTVGDISGFNTQVVTVGDAHYSQLGHNHDDRYYTELEADTLLAAKQNHDTGLDELAALAPTANDIVKGVAGAFSLLSLTPSTFPARAAAGDMLAYTIDAFGFTILNTANASAARTALGLGTLATQNGTFSGTSSGTNTGDQDLSGYSLIGHTHDDRYYTESEVDTLLSGKANTSHTHVASDITDFTSSVQTVGDARYSQLGHTHTVSQVSDGTTVGRNLVTLTNPSAITFIRINADNTVTALSASDFRTAIGAGTSSFDGVFSSLTGKPTTISGYGITDGVVGPSSVTADTVARYSGTTGKLIKSSTLALTDGGLAVLNTTSATTNAVIDALRLVAISSGTAAAGFGGSIQFYAQIDTGSTPAQSRIQSVWVSATSPTQKGRIIVEVVDTTYREILRGETTGSAPAIGFLGATAVVRQTGDVGTALVQLGLMSGTPTATSALETTACAKNTIFSGPTTGSDATPTFRVAVVADLPSLTGLTTAAIADADELAFADASASNANKKTTAEALRYFATSPLVILQDVKTQNTAGGTATADGTWKERTLTDETYDSHSMCSLSSNRFTLSAGTWQIEAKVLGFQCSVHQARLFNVTDNAVVTGIDTKSVLGSSEYSSTTGGTPSYSTINNVFTIAASKALSIQQQYAATAATQGQGVASNFAAEIYTQVILRRLA